MTVSKGKKKLAMPPQSELGGGALPKCIENVDVEAHVMWKDRIFIVMLNCNSTVVVHRAPVMCQARDGMLNTQRRRKHISILKKLLGIE